MRIVDTLSVATSGRQMPLVSDSNFSSASIKHTSGVDSYRFPYKSLLTPIPVFRLDLWIKSLFSFAFILGTGFSQTALSEKSQLAPVAISTPVEQPSASTTNESSSRNNSITNRQGKSSKASLALLTPTERQQVSKAHQQALQDPAVQSTRQIVRIALHKAMLSIDPSLQSVLANLETGDSSKNNSPIDTEVKSVNDKTASSSSPSSHPILASEDRLKLRAAHNLAMKNPAVVEARKTARITLYNAMINADPMIGPLLAKAGIKAPANIEASTKSSSIGSEEKILGSGNAEQWNKEVLDPAIKKDNQAEGISAPSPAGSTTTSPAPSSSPSV